MKVLVTGGAGFIASHVVDAFVGAGHEVVVVDDLSTGASANVNSAARLVKMDIRDAQLLELIRVEQPEVIDHHAAHIHVGRSVENPTHDAEVNILGTLNVLAGAQRAGSVKHVIFASTGGAMYGDKPTPFDESMAPQPLSPYGISKRAAELYLYFYFKQYGIGYTALRYANVYGPRQNPFGEAGVISIFFEGLKAGKQPVINGDGTQTRDYVFVGDVAAANVLALEKRAIGEFNIGTMIETDVNEIYRLVAQAAQSTVAAEHGPARAGEQTTSSLRYDAAVETLGWKPGVSLVDGIVQTAAFFLS